VLLRLKGTRSFSLWLVLVVSILGLDISGPLSAQCNPGNGVGGTGPDVVVGELTTPSSYGNAGGYYAYSVGTTSCNIGTAGLNWIASTPDHPVIAQNMYRLKDGRFEQIGMSWLKHGFAALQGNTCGCGCAPGSGSLLGVGCSDPYSAGLNGSQSSLGARSEVIDPTSGQFIYPRVLQPPTLDLTTRRLRVRGEDLDPTLNPGALYFVEGHYLAPDDAAAGNAHNNASYRQISVGSTPANYPLSYVGGTQRQLQGIRAWSANDPSVTLIEIADGSGGLFILGYKVNEILGTGLYQYEYALYNMDSTRGARLFNVPMPSGVVASDIGFHDVEYHSTEVFDGTDWVATAAGGLIEWSTSTAAQNANANALRWGTLYNFRFVANSPPGPATATIGLFESGIPALLTVAVEGPTATTLDCNMNGVVDADEIAGGAPDCDNNGLLDECQADCDGDSLADACEILAGSDQDCDGDLIPDSCAITQGLATDCDGDGLLDHCQIQQGLGTDCDGDGQLDACQITAGLLADCDMNGEADLCQIDAGSATDCDNNGEIDDCQVTAGTLEDCDGDGTADLCEILLALDVDCDNNALLDSCEIATNPDLDCDANGLLDSCEATGVFPHPVIVSPPAPVDGSLPPAVSTVPVTIPGVIADVDVGVDITHVFIGDVTVDVASPAGTSVVLHDNTGGTSNDIITTYDDEGAPGTTIPAQPLSAFDGETALGTWTLTAGDNFPADSGVLNGWNLFVGILGAGIPDCNNNGIHDDCELASAGDCNGNGTLDECDISSGTSADVNNDGVPDECSNSNDFVNGDANVDGNHDLSDAVMILEYLFNGAAVSCLAALNCNGDGNVDVADATTLLSYLFDSTAPPAAPFPACGPESGGSLGCFSFGGCP